jgi:ferritin-like metal-binding protein YciE
MEEAMAKSGTLQDLFIDELRDAYDAERQLTRALPRLAKASSSAALQDAFESHLEETKGHLDRLERVFEMLGEKVQGTHCEGMTGLVDEGRAILDEDLDEFSTDAGLIAAAQRVEHYEMAAYGALVAWARIMELNEAADLLQTTLDEEKAADEKLSSLAEGGINQQAADAVRSAAEEGDAVGAGKSKGSSRKR